MAKGMMIYEAEMEVLLSLEEENRSHIITSLICGRLGKEAPNLNPMENAVFTLIREQTKRSAKLSDTRSDSVNERWKKRENCIQYETTEEQDNPGQSFLPIQFLQALKIKLPYAAVPEIQIFEYRCHSQKN